MINLDHRQCMTILFGSLPYPRHFSELGGSIYFLGLTEIEGIALWRVAQEGIALVSSLPFPGSCADYYDPHHMVSSNGVLYLSDEGSLWQSDGTTKGTSEVFTFEGSVSSMSPIKDGILLVESDRRDRLWKVVGTEVVLLSDFSTGGCFGGTVTEVAATSDLLFLSVSSGSVEHELWVSDGTSAGTHQVKDFFPGVRGSNPQSLCAVDDIVVFAADDGTYGHELWRSDGTEQGTFLVDDIHRDRYASSPTHITQAGPLVYFAADDGTGRELWAVRIKDLLDRAPRRPGGRRTRR